MGADQITVGVTSNETQLKRIAPVPRPSCFSSREGFTLKPANTIRLARCKCPVTVYHMGSSPDTPHHRGQGPVDCGGLKPDSVNGAYNILRQALPNAFGKGTAGAAVHPVRLSMRTKRVA